VNAPLHAPASDRRPTVTQPEKQDDVPRGFVQLPCTILFNADLSPGARITYAVLLSYSWDKGECFPGQRRLCKELGVSLPTLLGYLRQLEGAALIRRIVRGRGKTTLYLLSAIDEQPNDEALLRALRELPYEEYLQTDHWKAVAEKARKQANFTCAVCGSRKELNVHHTTYKRKGQEDPDDLVVLCAACHGNHHGKL